MNEESKDCTRLPVVCFRGIDPDGGEGFVGAKWPDAFGEACIVEPLCRLTDAQALLAEKDAENKALEQDYLRIISAQDEKHRQQVAQFRQHKNDYMESAEQTRKALRAENARQRSVYIEDSKRLHDLNTLITDLRAENSRLRTGMVGDYDLDAWLDWAKEAEALRAHITTDNSETLVNALKEIERLRAERDSYRAALEGAEYQNLDVMGSQSIAESRLVGEAAKQCYLDIRAQRDVLQTENERLREISDKKDSDLMQMDALWRQLQAEPSGEVVVTKNEAGAIVAVTRQNEDGQILSVIAEAAPAERVVVLPERMETEAFTTIDKGSKNYKAGWNRALDEVARLNPAPATAEQAWIPVGARLPYPDQVVALMNDDVWMNTGADGFDCNWHGAGYLVNSAPRPYWNVFGETRAQCLDAATHWMPLPAAPATSDTNNQQPANGEDYR